MKWGELRKEIETDLDLQEETMITSEDLKVYANDAIKQAEKIVNTFTEGKYFDSNREINIVGGTAKYPLTGVYANKVVQLFAHDGDKKNKYEVFEVKGSREIAFIQDEDPFKYGIENDGGLASLVLYPTPQKSVTNGLHLFFVRNAATIVNDETVLDIPEAIGFIKQFVKDCCINKERLSPDAPPSPALLAQQEILVHSIQKQTNNDNTELAADYSAYAGQCI